MTKEKSLSEKEDNFLDMNIDTKIFYKKDVKEAVEKLKEEILEMNMLDYNTRVASLVKIDKIFGEFK